jgi:hypothetical protein
VMITDLFDKKGLPYTSEAVSKVGLASKFDHNYL